MSEIRGDGHGAAPALPQDIRSIRRVIGSLGADGRSTVQSDENTPYVKQASPTMDFAELWETPSVPPGIAPSFDAAAHAPEGLEPSDPAGSLFRVVCLAPDPPGFDVVATMHSTRTIDCVIVVSGVVTAVFEDGSEVDLHPGDSLVHRGVPHAWSNRGSEPCVFYDVMISALDHAPEAS